MKMSSVLIQEGTGCVTWWGFGPARDLLETVPVGVPGQQRHLNVLLVGGADPRHILKTISGLRDTDTLHIWVIEDSIEIVARQLLLLYVSLSSPESMGMQEKTEVFLELFGNGHIRSQTDNTLKYIAAQMSLFVTGSPNTDSPPNPCLDTSLLKFKERDGLDMIFKLWQRPPSTPLTMNKAWNARVRKHLGTRYDARNGCFDWDLNMKLHDRGCRVIHKLQYCRWRESGLAFELREGLYSVDNQSLLSTRVLSRQGVRVLVRGYWGDIVSSPYLSFGIETENKELLKKQNNQHVKTAQDISVANVQMLFSALLRRREEEHANAFQHARGSGDEAAGIESPEELEGKQMLVDQQEVIKPKLMNLFGLHVSFLPLDSLQKLSTKSQFCRLFNAIYFSASMVHLLDSSLTQTAAPDAVLIVELVKYMLDLSKPQEASFPRKVIKIAQEAGFVPAHSQESDECAVFRLR